MVETNIQIMQTLIRCFLVLFLFVSNSEEKTLTDVRGYTAPGWQFVREIFRKNFESGLETGAAVAIYHQGRLVVDLQGGWADRAETKIYDQDTLQLVYSTTKGVVAVAVALCVQRGLLDYNAPVTKYWPEYGQNGKENTTVADILSHRAGVPDDPSYAEYFYNWTAMVNLLEKRKPVWQPGTAQGYHALTYGWLAGELVRRVDPKKRSIGKFVQEEIADPLGIEFYIGLPDNLEHRVSPLLFDDALPYVNETGMRDLEFFNQPLTHRAEIPAGNGICNARSLAKIYSSLLTNIDEKTNSRLLTEETLRKALKRISTNDNEIDLTFGFRIPFAMGFMLYDGEYSPLGKLVFGHSGE